ncbi:hypothetical protein ADUPG1_007215, partial [Aduncisulcus paluster]
MKTMLRSPSVEYTAVLPHIETIIAMRNQPSQEFLCKIVGRAYHDLVWLSGDFISSYNNRKLDPKIKMFTRKISNSSHKNLSLRYNPTQPISDSLVCQFRSVFSPDYLIAERILCSADTPTVPKYEAVYTPLSQLFLGIPNGPEEQLYLVKWVHQNIDMATWETKGSLESIINGPEVLAAFESGNSDKYPTLDGLCSAFMGDSKLDYAYDIGKDPQLTLLSTFVKSCEVVVNHNTLVGKVSLIDKGDYTGPESRESLMDAMLAPEVLARHLEVLKQCPFISIASVNAPSWMRILIPFLVIHLFPLAVIAKYPSLTISSLSFLPALASSGSTGPIPLLHYAPCVWGASEWLSCRELGECMSIVYDKEKSEKDAREKLDVIIKQENKKQAKGHHVTKKTLPVPREGVFASCRWDELLNMSEEERKENGWNSDIPSNGSVDHKKVLAIVSAILKGDTTIKSENPDDKASVLTNYSHFSFLSSPLIEMHKATFSLSPPRVAAVVRKCSIMFHLMLEFIGVQGPLLLIGPGRPDSVSDWLDELHTSLPHKQVLSYFGSKKTLQIMRVIDCFKCGKIKGRATKEKVFGRSEGEKKRKNFDPLFDLFATQIDIRHDIDVGTVGSFCEHVHTIAEHERDAMWKDDFDPSDVKREGQIRVSVQSSISSSSSSDLSSVTSSSHSSRIHGGSTSSSFRRKSSHKSTSSSVSSSSSTVSSSAPPLAISGGSNEIVHLKSHPMFSSPFTCDVMLTSLSTVEKDCGFLQSILWAGMLVEETPSLRQSGSYKKLPSLMSIIARTRYLLLRFIPQLKPSQALSNVTGFFIRDFRDGVLGNVESASLLKEACIYDGRICQKIRKYEKLKSSETWSIKLCERGTDRKRRRRESTIAPQQPLEPNSGDVVGTGALESVELTRGSTSATPVVSSGANGSNNNNSGHNVYNSTHSKSKSKSRKKEKEDQSSKKRTPSGNSQSYQEARVMREEE